MQRLATRFSYLSFLLLFAISAQSSNTEARDKLPREVTVASITLMSPWGAPVNTMGTTVDERIDKSLERMEQTAAYKPDIVCLSEAFPHADLPDLPPYEGRAEILPGPIVKHFTDYAKKHNCYVICPMYTKRDGHIYNAAVLIDRKGQIVGEYDKVHPTEGEVRKGITPGPAEPPVFETDFGTIGMMICFDANWPKTWKKLREKGAEIVFWPSAFAGGALLNALAMQNTYYIVSCTRYQPARIIDITGKDIGGNGRLQEWFCSTINLDREVFHWDFQDGAFRDIQQKYGDKFKYEIAHPEGWFILESNDESVSIEQIKREYKLVNYHEYIERAEKVQVDSRP